MSEAVDPARCPLCGEPNACARVAGQARCWCFDVRLRPEVLDRVPASARGVACLCSTCAAGAAPRRRRASFKLQS